MHPILFEIPGLNFPIRSFGLMVAIGFIVGSSIFTRLAARYGDDPEQDPARYGSITMWIVAGVVLGARTLYVIVEMLRGSEVGQGFMNEPLSVLYVWKGGLVMYGGFTGAVLVGLWGAKRMQVRPIHALDLGLVAGFVGQAIGRVGCFLVGDDYGKPVPESLQWLPFPITLRVPELLPKESLFGEENAGKLIFATQPLMLIKALIVAFIGYQILKRRRYAGQVSAWIILTYAVLRFCVEFLRGDSVRGVWFGGLISTSQVLSIGGFLLATVWLVRNRNTTNPLPDARRAKA